MLISIINTLLLILNIIVLIKGIEKIELKIEDLENRQIEACNQIFFKLNEKE